MFQVLTSRRKDQFMRRILLQKKINTIFTAVARTMVPCYLARGEPNFYNENCLRVDQSCYRMRQNHSLFSLCFHLA